MVTCRIRQWRRSIAIILPTIVLATLSTACDKQTTSPIVSDDAVGAGASALSSITVVGLNTYPDDIQAVQDAVDNYSHVTLEGVFDFGPYRGGGQVGITRDNVTLQGAEGATITGGGRGGNPASTVYGLDCENLTVRDITFVGSYEALGMYTYGTSTVGNVTTFEDNEFRNCYYTIFVYRTNGTVDIVGNKCTQISYGPYVYRTAGAVRMVDNDCQQATYGLLTYQCESGFEGASIEIRNNNVSGFLGIYSRYNRCPVTISNNTVDVFSYGIAAFGWYHTQSFKDNGPVQIIDNYIHMRDSEYLRLGMMLGSSAAGLNNSLARDNTIEGLAGVGIARYPYGHDVIVTDNDLSNLTTYRAQIWAMGRNDIFTDNTLGLATAIDPVEGIQWGTGINVWSPNFHADWPVPTPDPQPVANNTFTGNDFTRTGLLPWEFSTDDPSSEDDILNWGCMLLYPYTPGTEVRDNFVKETGRFPRGTGGAEMNILDFGANNRIIGHAAKEMTHPGIGQVIKEALANVAERVLQAELELLDVGHSDPEGGN